MERDDDRRRVEDWASTFTWTCYGCGEATVTYSSEEDYDLDEDEHPLVSCPACGAQYVVPFEMVEAYFLEPTGEEGGKGKEKKAEGQLVPFPGHKHR